MSNSFDSALRDLTAKLEAAKIPPSGVEFVGKGLKLNNAEDAKPIIDAIQNLQGPLEFLNLEGNTIGVEAAEAIAKALEDKPELKFALWKDMFTSRLKTEIPPALSALSNSLMIAGARLEVLDLSDNASGPIGVDGISKLLSSEVCWSLKELRLANMGLGTSGAQKLAAALQKCLELSTAAGNPFALKVFVAGRNRLENVGCIALSKVFKKIGTLEEIQIYQNAIYHPGIEVLSDALMSNPNLKYLNLNDNTITVKGAVHLCQALEKLPHLTSLNVGDCLLRSDGAVLIADVMKESLPKLETLVMTSNEISGEAGTLLAHALANKKHLKHVQIGENSFGSKLDNIDRIIREGCGENTDLTLSISDDEGSCDEEDDDEEDYEDEEDVDEEYHREEEEDDIYGEDDDESDGYSGDEYPTTIDTRSPMLRNLNSQNDVKPTTPSIFSKQMFTPGCDYDQIMNKIDSLPANDRIEELLNNIVTVANTMKDNPAAEKVGMKLYSKLFDLAASTSSLPLVNNLIPAYSGLIKSERKSGTSPNFDKFANESLLRKAISAGIVPKETMSILDFLMNRGSEKNNN